MDLIAFLTVLATLSASTQTLVDVLIKKWWKWLAEEKPDPGEERKRVALIHVLAAAVGCALALVTGLEPLAHLNLHVGKAFNAVACGVLVSFGGGFFNDLLGVLRELKGAQRALKEERLRRLHDGGDLVRA
jgi:hypothetical protein